MLKKGTVINSILTGSCPKCQEESMYVEKNPYKLSTLYKMHDTCSHCHTQYKIEPSFFYGAMYVSYGVTVAIGVAVILTVPLVLSGYNLAVKYFTEVSVDGNATLTLNAAKPPVTVPKETAVPVVVIGEINAPLTL